MTKYPFLEYQFLFFAFAKATLELMISYDFLNPLHAFALQLQYLRCAEIDPSYYQLERQSHDPVSIGKQEKMLSDGIQQAQRRRVIEILFCRICSQPRGESLYLRGYAHPGCFPTRAFNLLSISL
jgi:hypothetical protein